MWIIRNTIIPFKGFKAMNFFGILFCRKDALVDEVTINHERIHTAQMVEMLFMFFYIWYGVEYLIKLIRYGNSHKAYRRIGFEQEANLFEDIPNYRKTRKHYAWIKYI